MVKKQKVFRLTIWLLVLIIGMVIISARGCPKRSRNKIGNSSPAEWSLRSPVNLTATSFSSSQINLSWALGTGIGTPDGYEIWRSLDGTNYELLTTTNANIYSDTSVTPSNTYYYRVRAFNTIGDYSAYSNKVSAFTYLGND
jgi:hypothetical protein